MVRCKSAKAEVAAPNTGGRQEEGRNITVINLGVISKVVASVNG